MKILLVFLLVLCGFARSGHTKSTRIIPETEISPPIRIFTQKNAKYIDVNIFHLDDESKIEISVKTADAILKKETNELSVDKTRKYIVKSFIHGESLFEEKTFYFDRSTLFFCGGRVPDFSSFWKFVYPEEYFQKDSEIATFSTLMQLKYDRRINLIRVYKDNQKLAEVTLHLVDRNIKKTDTTHMQAIHISGGMYEQNNFNWRGSYLTNSADFREVDEFSSNYEVVVKNIKKETTAYYNTRSSSLSEGTGLDESFSLDVPIAVEDVFIELYRKYPFTYLGQVVIPTDIIKEEIENLPNEAIVKQDKAISELLLTNIEHIRSEFQTEKTDIFSIINSLDEKIKKVVEDKTINLEVRDSLKADRDLLKGVIQTSIIRLRSLIAKKNKMETDYIKILPLENMRVGKISQIRIQPKRHLVNSNQVYVVKAWFDGFESKTSFKNGLYIATSPKSQYGTHFWFVQVYLVSKELLSQYEGKIKKLQLEQSKLEQEWERAEGVGVKYEINLKRMRLIYKIEFETSKFNDALIKVGEAADVKFKAK